MPNCRAIAEGLTPALKAARTAFSLPVVNEPAACPAGVASAVGFSFARLGGSRPRRSASVVTAASRASISALSSRFSAPARSWGKKWRGGARLPALALLCGTARGSGALAVGGAENRSGVVSAGRRVGMTPTMPPASDRGNGLAEMEDQGRARAPERATAARTGFRPSSRRDQWPWLRSGPKISSGGNDPWRAEFGIPTGAVQQQARPEPRGGRNIRRFTEISYLVD